MLNYGCMKKLQTKEIKLPLCCISLAFPKAQCIVCYCLQSLLSSFLRLSFHLSLLKFLSDEWNAVQSVLEILETTLSSVFSEYIVISCNLQQTAVHCVQPKDTSCSSQKQLSKFYLCSTVLPISRTAYIANCLNFA